MIKKIIDFLFPNYCGICGNKINTSYTCEKCSNILECYKERVLMHTASNAHFDKLLCLFEYSGIMKQKMLEFKFSDKKYISRTLGELAFKKIKKYDLQADYLIPVPISKQRMFERGYNQSEYIANFLSEFCKIKVLKNCLIKSRNNSKQSLLSASERQHNVKNAYAVKNPEKIKGKTIMLIDDIMTTGATINECAKELKKYGAKEVIAIALLYSVRGGI